MKFAHCLSIVVVIGKYTDIFRGWGIVLGLDFYGRILTREVSGGTGEFSRKNLHWGDLIELLYEFIFNCITISLPNFSHGDAPREIIQGVFFRVFFSGK